MSDVKELNINNTTYDIKAKSVVDTNSGKLKFWSGTRQEYDAIVTKDNNTLYWVTDSKIIYLGDNAVSNFKGGRNVGEIIQSSLPLTDAGLHLLDGSRLSGDGIYKGFVDYVAELYNDTKVYNPSAFTVVGSPTITADGIASGFSTSDYLTTSQTISGIWKCTALVNCTNGEEDSFGNGIFSGSNSSTEVFYVGIRNRRLQVHLGNIYNDRLVTPIFENNVNYLFELGFTGAKYYLKINNNEVLSVDSTTPLINVGNIQIGTRAINRSAYFRGSIDLKQFSITVDGKEVFSGSKPAKYFTDETTWQQSVTTYGSCGKFVYDSELNTVRLPKVSDILQGTTNISALGDLVEAGLPNITGNLYNISETWNAFGNTDGSFYKSTGYNAGDTPAHTDNSDSGAIHFNASRASSIYGNSTTVQPQTIKCFVYIVIATSSKTEIQSDIDEIAADLNGKADVDGSNMNASVKNFDGQWVLVNTQISTATAQGIYTLDLSSYLPNDNYLYEVVLTQEAQGQAATPITTFATNYSSANGVWNSLNMYLTTNLTLCVGTNREITMNITQASFQVNRVKLCAYRRIGTNQ